jgi:hypothetical protein
MPGPASIAEPPRPTPASPATTEPRPARVASGDGARRFSPGALAAALVVFVFGFLPVMNWVEGTYHDPMFGLRVTEWVTGTAIVVGLGIVLAMLTRRRASSAATHDASRGSPMAALRAAIERPAFTHWVIPAAALLLYVVVASVVFDRQPLLIDEVVQRMQAAIFAEGRLWLPAPAQPELTTIQHVVVADGRTYGHFPPGHSALLAIGLLVGAAWLVVPMCGALAVALFARLLVHAEPRPAVRALAVALFAFAPFAMFMNGSQMSHVTVTTFTLLGALGLVAAMSSGSPRPWIAFVGGLGFGAAAAMRPADALMFALPAAVWLLARALREPRRWTDALAMGAGVALPLAAMMLVNANTTGHPLQFGYTVLWGPGHGIGFHKAPWGQSHTPAHGVELLNLYYLGFQENFFESPLPSLVPVIVGLLLARRLGAADRYLLVGAGLLTVLYWAYWGEGFFLGPRFFYPLAPVVALWAARAPFSVRERVGDGMTSRAFAWSLVAAALVAVGYGIPARWARYSRGFQAERWDIAARAREAGVSNAIVVVRDGWDAQLQARLWALDVPHPETELIHSHVDACRLELAVTSLERSGVRGDAAKQALWPLLTDSARVRGAFVATSAQVYLDSASVASYPPRCAERLATTRAGITPFTPAILAHGRDGNLYARDLRERTLPLLEANPARPVWLLAPAGPGGGEKPALRRVSRDSLVRAWSGAESGS